MFVLAINCIVTDPHDQEVLPADCHRQRAKPPSWWWQKPCFSGDSSPCLSMVKDIVTKADLKDSQGDVDRSP